MTGFLHRPPTPLPSQSDFDPFGGDLDAQSAWRTFGGLSLADAYAKFLNVPESYQEDFMFMGSRAFAYYFPVVDLYLRTVSLAPDDLGDCEAAILGSDISYQLNPKHAPFSAELLEEIESLHTFVIQNLHRYTAAPEDRQNILRKWTQVAEAVQQCRRLQ